MALAPGGGDPAFGLGQPGQHHRVFLGLSGGGYLAALRASVAMLVETGAGLVHLAGDGQDWAWASSQAAGLADRRLALIAHPRAHR